MKKILAALLALAMVFSLAACGGGETGESKDPGTSNPGTTNTDAGTVESPGPAGPSDAEPIDVEPLYYWGFENADGLTAVYQAAPAENPDLTGANFALMPSAHEIMIAEGKGVSGNALYLDGKYGVKLDGMGAVSDDTYTISFWYAASRFSLFGPMVAMGRNVGMNDTENTVTWISFTKADDWSVDASDATPVVWNRNSTEGVWPWIGANDGVHGRKEWCHVVLVVDGSTYKDDLGLPHVGAQVYVDGVLMMEATTANTADTWMGVAPEILTGDGIYGVEGLVGINYWDKIYKGYIDELYVYDEALTAGQVTTLYQMGNPSGEYEDLTYEGPVDEVPEEPEPEPLPEITPDASAIDTIGAITRDNGFWTDTSDGFEIKDGGSVTMKFNNYSDGASVWNNPVFAYSNTAVTTDKIAGAGDFPGYAEYGVTRVDGIDGAAWGAGTATFEKSWPDDATFMEVMKDAEVTAVFSRAVNVITVDVTIVGADGTTFTETIVFTANEMAADAPCYVHITNEHCYIELLSVE